MQHRTLTTLATALGVVALAGCGSSKTDESSTDHSMAGMHHGDGKAIADPRSRVTFATPRNGATEPKSFTARVRLKHFEISPTMVGSSPVPGHGHLHFILDGGKFDYPRYSGPNGAIGKKLGVAGKYSPSLAPKITYHRIPRGRHTLIVELANNNHTSTGIEAVSHITVK
jgi:hypothetical protein